MSDLHFALVQLEALRSEMSVEVARLLDLVELKAARIASLQAELRARIDWGVAVLLRQQRLGVMRHAFTSWRCGRLTMRAVAEPLFEILVWGHAALRHFGAGDVILQLFCE